MKHVNLYDEGTTTSVPSQASNYATPLVGYPTPTTTNLIYKLMSDVMKEIGFIGKDQKNDTQGFKFRGIDQFVNALYPALTKHGVFMVPSCVQETHELRDVVRSSGKAGVDKHVHLLMNYTFYASDGSHVTIGPIPGEGLDTGDKATNKALSATLKYALIQTFSIPTSDMEEADSTSPVIATGPNPKQENKATKSSSFRRTETTPTDTTKNGLNF